MAGHPADIDYALTITVYDLAHDPSVVSVASIDLYINPLRLDDLGDGLLMTQVVGYRNDSDRLYTSGRGFEDGREASSAAAGSGWRSDHERGREWTLRRG